MNKLIKFSHIFIALILALGAVGFSASTALAAQPVKGNNAITFTPPPFGAGELCSFPVNVSVYFAWSWIDFYDDAGNWTMEIFHQAEQDTFTANEKTVVTDLYQNSGYYKVDANGELYGYVSGSVGRYRTPDGKIISINAGRTKLDPYGGFTWAPDNGSEGDLAAFCAALAP